ADHPCRMKPARAEAIGGFPGNDIPDQGSSGPWTDFPLHGLTDAEEASLKSCSRSVIRRPSRAGHVKRGAYDRSCRDASLCCPFEFVLQTSLRIS
ncbi:MAG: hypothetical protein OXD42_03960, partial [Rhodospirillaceae bacterium]|nr:hypothetical protein [Rhodospirillaceae bacterium]